VTRSSIRAALLSGGLLLAGGCRLAPQSIELPPETAELRPAPAPGYRIALDKCGICHSADYIALQPPGMSFAQWSAELQKMKRAYGAPLDDDDIKLVAAYLAAEYGDASTVPP
jgi:mono/diheme cytochrome c family protein